MASLPRHPLARIAGFSLLYLLLVQALLMLPSDRAPATWATVVGVAFVLYAPIAVFVMRRLVKKPVPPEQQWVVVNGLVLAPIFVTGALTHAGAAEWTVWAAFAMAVLITAESTRSDAATHGAVRSVERRSERRRAHPQVRSPPGRRLTAQPPLGRTTVLPEAPGWCGSAAPKSRVDTRRSR